MASILWLVVRIAAIGFVMSNAFAYTPYVNFTRRSWREQIYSSVPLYHLGTSFLEEQCTVNHEFERTEIIQKAQCGEPKRVEVKMFAAVYIQLTPSIVWLKQCVGYCSDHIANTCVPSKLNQIRVPVRIYNAKTDKESCGLFDLEEHVSCECDVS